jgi:hypothetical protein
MIQILVIVLVTIVVGLLIIASMGIFPNPKAAQKHIFARFVLVFISCGVVSFFVFGMSLWFGFESSFSAQFELYMDNPPAAPYKTEIVREAWLQTLISPFVGENCFTDNDEICVYATQLVAGWKFLLISGALVGSMIGFLFTFGFVFLGARLFQRFTGDVL